jgi:hypothetical protein
MHFIANGVQLSHHVAQASGLIVEGLATFLCISHGCVLQF